MKKANLVLRCLDAAVLLVLIWLLLWGKLFPFSPVLPGFIRHELAHTVVYVQRGADFREYETVDACVPPVEAFHELRFVRKPRLFVFRDRQSYLQRSPSRARFCAFPGGSLVISPWALEEARQGQISLDIYLRHELSHTLVFQHAGLLRAIRYPRWLLEGLATYSAHQMGTSFYPSQAETYAAIRQGNFVPPEDFATRREDRIPLQVQFRKGFIYSEFACLVDYLVEQYGRDRLLAYVNALMRDSNNARVFRGIYGVDFPAAVAQFREAASTPKPRGLSPKTSRSDGAGG
ncbi:hypothetical protein LLH23_15950 [bacterium]|nr:hypothetical protein [bacterium]